MHSKAETVIEYLDSLPADRRTAMGSVRELILSNLDKDYEEGMNCGMIGYFVPHRIYPAGYHCDPKKPLPFANLASQENHMSLYLMSLYGESGGNGPASERTRWFREEWEKTGKKLDMGKACIRFKTIEELPLALIGEAIRRVPAKEYIKHYEASLARARGRKATTA